MERITLTNMVKDIQQQARVILYPLHLDQANVSATVEASASGNKAGAQGSDSWATVCVHVPSVLKLFSSLGGNAHLMPHAHVLKSVQICATCVVRNIFTSDMCFSCHAELPREMKLTQKESSAALVSNWINIPASIGTTAGGTTSKMAAPALKNKSAENTGGNGVSFLSNPVGIMSGTSASEFGAGVRPARQQQLAEQLHVGNMNTINQTLDASTIMGSASEIMEQSNYLTQQSTKIAINTGPQQAQAFANQQQGTSQSQKLLPDPLLEVSNLLGVSAGSKNMAFWLGDSGRIVFASASALIVMPIGGPTNAVDESSFVETAAIGFDRTPMTLFGHTKPISLLMTSAAGDWIASVQQGSSTTSAGGAGEATGTTSKAAAVAAIPGGDQATSSTPSVRLWHVANVKFSRPKCVTILSCQSLLVIKQMAFDPWSKYLAIAGIDTQRRQQIFVWDIGRVTRGNNAVLYARQMSDWDLNAIKFSPYEDLKLVTCGKENIRFWRVKDAHLPGQSVTLNSLARNTVFTDLCFEANIKKDRGEAFVGADTSLGYNLNVFVATQAGEVAVVSYKDRQVLMLHKLHNSPITAISATDSFCVTAAEDKYIRVCPLDFQSFFLHCMHEAVPKGIDLSLSGTKVLSYCADGTIGQLDLQTQAFDVLHRSHAGKIKDACVSHLFEEICTVTEDGFIKIWNLNTMRQHTEFFSGNDTPLAVNCHPKKHLIAVGFATGTLRLFDIDGPKVVGEYVNFTLPIKSLAFAELQETNILLACDEKGGMMLYCENEETGSFVPKKNLELFAGVHEPPVENCSFFELANNHRMLLKWYDSRTVVLFAFTSGNGNPDGALDGVTGMQVEENNADINISATALDQTRSRQDITNVQIEGLNASSLSTGGAQHQGGANFTPDLDFLRKFQLRSGVASSASDQQKITTFQFSFDSTKVIIGTSHAKLKVFSVKGPLLYDIPLVAGMVSAVSLVGPVFTSSAGNGQQQQMNNLTTDSLLFTASKEDSLVKASLLQKPFNQMNNLSVSTHSNNKFSLLRQEEQCFLGHAVAPFKLLVTPSRLVGVSNMEVITWKMSSGGSSSAGARTGSSNNIFEELFYNQHLRQDALPTAGSTAINMNALSQSTTSVAVLDQQQTLATAGLVAHQQPKMGNSFMFYPASKNSNISTDNGASTSLYHQQQQSALLMDTTIVEPGYQQPYSSESPVKVTQMKKQQQQGVNNSSALLQDVSTATILLRKSAEMKDQQQELQEKTILKHTADKLALSSQSVKSAKSNASSNPKMNTSGNNKVTINETQNLSMLIEANLQAEQDIKKKGGNEDEVQTALLEEKDCTVEFEDETLIETSGKTSMLRQAAEVEGSKPVKYVASCTTGLEQTVESSPTTPPVAELATIVGTGSPFCWQECYLAVGVGNWVSIESKGGLGGTTSSNTITSGAPPAVASSASGSKTSTSSAATVKTTVAPRASKTVIPNLEGNVCSLDGLGKKNWLAVLAEEAVYLYKIELDENNADREIEQRQRLEAAEDTTDCNLNCPHKLLAAIPLSEFVAEGAEEQEEKKTAKSLSPSASGGFFVKFLEDGEHLIVTTNSVAPPKDGNKNSGFTTTSSIHVIRIIHDTIENQYCLEVICATTLMNETTKILDLQVAPWNEFITLTAYGLTFWRLDSVTKSLQFQETNKPDWLVQQQVGSLQGKNKEKDPASSKTAHQEKIVGNQNNSKTTDHVYTCMTFVQISQDVSRVLVGTSRGTLLTFDFEENLPINEIKSLPNNYNSDKITNVQAPAYPILLCAIGATICKYVIYEAGNKLLSINSGASSGGAGATAKAADNCYNSSGMNIKSASKASTGSSSSTAMALVEKPIALDSDLKSCAGFSTERGNGIFATNASLWYVNWRTNVKMRLHSFHTKVHLGGGSSNSEQDQHAAATAFSCQSFDVLECSSSSKHDGNKIATCGAVDGLVRLWSCSSSNNSSEQSGKNGSKTSTLSSAATNAITATSPQVLTSLAQFSGVSPCLSLTFLSSRVLFCGFEDGCVRLFDLENLTSIGRVEVEESDAIVVVKALSPQAAIAATRNGKVVQIMIRLSSTREVIDARRAELKPANNEKNVTSAIDVNHNTDQFLIAFSNSEVYIWQTERKRKPVLKDVWVMPKSAEMMNTTTSSTMAKMNLVQACFIPQHNSSAIPTASNKEDLIAASSNKIFYVYDLSNKKVLHRLELDAEIYRVCCFPKLFDQTPAAGIPRTNRTSRVSASHDKSKQNSVMVLTKDNVLGEIYWPEQSTAHAPSNALENPALYRERVPFAGPGTSVNGNTDLKFLHDSRLVVKTESGLCVWDL
ncbi:unnamed protein product [Amoebophrya sp. A120]|nr:unnamed protein product [Amoebophrya sp. A120]|eukprot:GSA120T00024691001.1